MQRSYKMEELIETIKKNLINLVNNHDFNLEGSDIVFFIENSSLVTEIKVKILRLLTVYPEKAVNLIFDFLLFNNPVLHDNNCAPYNLPEYTVSLCNETVRFSPVLEIPNSNILDTYDQNQNITFTDEKRTIYNYSTLLSIELIYFMLSHFHEEENQNVIIMIKEKLVTYISKIAVKLDLINKKQNYDILMRLNRCYLSSFKLNTTESENLFKELKTFVINSNTDKIDVTWLQCFKNAKCSNFLKSTQNLMELYKKPQIFSIRSNILSLPAVFSLLFSAILENDRFFCNKDQKSKLFNWIGKMIYSMDFDVVLLAIRGFNSYFSKVLIKLRENKEGFQDMINFEELMDLNLILIDFIQQSSQERSNEQDEIDLQRFAIFTIDISESQKTIKTEQKLVWNIPKIAENLSNIPNVINETDYKKIERIYKHEMNKIVEFLILFNKNWQLIQDVRIFTKISKKSKCYNFTNFSECLLLSLLDDKSHGKDKKIFKNQTLNVLDGCFLWTYSGSASLGFNIPSENLDFLNSWKLRLIWEKVLTAAIFLGKSQNEDLESEDNVTLNVFKLSTLSRIFCQLHNSKMILRDFTYQIESKSQKGKLDQTGTNFQNEWFIMQKNVLSNFIKQLYKEIPENLLIESIKCLLNKDLIFLNTSAYRLEKNIEKLNIVPSGILSDFGLLTIIRLLVKTGLIQKKMSSDSQMVFNNMNEEKNGLNEIIWGLLRQIPLLILHLEINRTKNNLKSKINERQGNLSSSSEEINNKNNKNEIVLDITGNMLDRFGSKLVLLHLLILLDWELENQIHIINSNEDKFDDQNKLLWQKKFQDFTKTLHYDHLEFVELRSSLTLAEGVDSYFEACRVLPENIEECMSFISNLITGFILQQQDITVSVCGLRILNKINNNTISKTKIGIISWQLLNSIFSECTGLNDFSCGVLKGKSYKNLEMEESFGFLIHLIESIDDNDLESFEYFPVLKENYFFFSLLKKVLMIPDRKRQEEKGGNTGKNSLNVENRYHFCYKRFWFYWWVHESKKFRIYGVANLIKKVFEGIFNKKGNKKKGKKKEKCKLPINLSIKRKHDLSPSNSKNSSFDELEVDLFPFLTDETEDFHIKLCFSFLPALLFHFEPENSHQFGISPCSEFLQIIELYLWILRHFKYFFKMDEQLKQLLFDIIDIVINCSLNMIMGLPIIWDRVTSWRNTENETENSFKYLNGMMQCCYDLLMEIDDFIVAFNKVFILHHLVSLSIKTANKLVKLQKEIQIKINWLLEKIKVNTIKLKNPKFSDDPPKDIFNLEDLLKPNFTSKDSIRNELNSGMYNFLLNHKIQLNQQFSQNNEKVNSTVKREESYDSHDNKKCKRIEKSDDFIAES